MRMLGVRACAVRFCLLFLALYFTQQEKDAPNVTIKAMGRAIGKTITVAEIIKRRVAGLHQVRVTLSWISLR
jgi:DNA-binding protein Alba